MTQRLATLQGSSKVAHEGQQLRHDLLGSVHTLMGALELLFTTRLDARQLRYAGVCQRAAENLVTLSRNVSTLKENQSAERFAVNELAEMV